MSAIRVAPVSYSKMVQNVVGRPVPRVNPVKGTPVQYRHRFVAISIAALLLAACGGGGGHGGHSGGEKIVAPVEGASEVKVTAVDIDYKPATLELKAGEAVNVAITNEGDTTHDFTSEEAGVHVNLEPGDSKTTALKFDEAGSYKVLCTVAGHEDAGMTIDVEVK